MTSCTKNQCKSKGCPNRHPKPCRYKGKCKRIKTCKYLHEENQIIKLKMKEENEILSLETNKLKLEIENLKHQNITLEEQILKYKNEIKEQNSKSNTQCEMISEIKKEKTSLNIENKKQVIIMNDLKRDKLKIINENIKIKDEIKILNEKNKNMIIGDKPLQPQLYCEKLICDQFFRNRHDLKLHIEKSHTPYMVHN